VLYVSIQNGLLDLGRNAMAKATESRTGRLPDQRVKLVVFASYVAWLLLLKGFAVLAMTISAMAILLAFVSPAPGALYRRWARAFPAAVIVVALFWIFAPAEEGAWFVVLGKTFGPQGFWHGLFFAVRFLGFLLGGFYLYEVSSPEKMARALLWFLTPLKALKIPIHLLYYIIWFAARSIPVLAGEAQIISLAQRSRGVTFTGSPKRRLAGVLSLIVPVFAAAARRSDRFALALEARGFDPHSHYQAHPLGCLRPVDAYWLTGLTVLWMVFIAWWWRAL